MGKKIRFFYKLTFFILSIEVSLQIFSLGLSFFQTYLNERYNGSIFTIVTIGESTTADNTSLRYKSWPRVLEERLRAAGQNVQIVNLAKPGTNSNEQLISFLDYAKENKIHMVVSMLGINDSHLLHINNQWILNQDNWWYKIKLAKMTLFIWRLFVGILGRNDVQFSQSDMGIEETETFIDYIRSGNLAVFENIERRLEKEPNIKKAEYYYFLSTKLMPSWGASKFEFKASYEFHKKGFELNPRKDTAERQAILNLILGQKCGSILKVLQDKNIAPTITLIDRLWQCGVEEESKLLKYTLQYFPQITIDTQKRMDSLSLNYNNLAKISLTKKICFIAMQYPTLNLEVLKNNFESDIKDKIIFLENYLNFKEALKRHAFSDIFYDSFGKTFGHTTDLGVEIIMEVLYPAVEKHIKNLNCVGS